MASPPAPQHEPTMEEILASIRKIISEDSTEQPAGEAESPDAEEDGDVLELTQEIHHEPQPEPAPEPVEESQPEEIRLEDDVVFEEIEEPTMSHAAVSDEGIFSDKTRSALDNAFAGLDQQPVSTPAPAFAMPQGDSVQAAFERAVRSGFEPLPARTSGYQHRHADGTHEAAHPRMDGRAFPHPAGKRGAHRSGPCCSGPRPPLIPDLTGVGESPRPPS